ncbi:MAG: hypothetical protein IPH26_08820 [Sterolibacteriaceae bacterium]|uniref:Uncharacterized protein n=1 Tax=Candidatus Methylophosphatis roskildensis TaxID=2899263 RepID=A0A9D7E3F8_9PROT|nr:hypothetical protein [Candidatus Methylophosphatis roskildensis]MBK7237564.1 hypothetical protein [Sterolibacteriaceae bacterium]
MIANLGQIAIVLVLLSLGSGITRGTAELISNHRIGTAVEAIVFAMLVMAATTAVVLVADTFLCAAVGIFWVVGFVCVSSTARDLMSTGQTGRREAIGRDPRR